MQCLYFALAAMLAFGCARSLPAPSSSGAAPARGAHSCPLGVPSVATIDDTADGAVFSFVSADPARVEELRQRARDSAAMHGEGAHRGLGHHGVHGGGQHHGLGLADLAPVTVRAEEIEHGARVRVSVTDPARVGAIRAQLHERAERVAEGECP